MDLEEVGITGRTLVYCSISSEEGGTPGSVSVSPPWLERSLHGHTLLLLLK